MRCATIRRSPKNVGKSRTVSNDTWACPDAHKSPLYTYSVHHTLYARLDPRGRGRIQIAAELPLLYAKGRHPQPPEVRFPDPEAPATPSRVRQSRLEVAPFLRSIPVYRYAC